MAVETGVAEFGEKGTYGVITKTDTVKLVRLAILGAMANPGEGFATRQLIRKMTGFIGAPDKVLLAELMKHHAPIQQNEWLALAEELLAQAGL